MTDQHLRFFHVCRRCATERLDAVREAANYKGFEAGRCSACGMPYTDIFDLVPVTVEQPSSETVIWDSIKVMDSRKA